MGNNGATQTKSKGIPYMVYEILIIAVYHMQRAPRPTVAIKLKKQK